MAYGSGRVLQQGEGTLAAGDARPPLLRRHRRLIAVLFLACSLAVLTAVLRVKDVPDQMQETQSVFGDTQMVSLKLSEEDRRTLKDSAALPTLRVGITPGELLQGDVYLDLNVPPQASPFRHPVTLSFRFPEGAKVQSELDGSVDCGVVDVEGSEVHVVDVDGVHLARAYAEVNCPIPVMAPGASGFLTFAFTTKDHGAYHAGITRRGSHLRVSSDAGAVGVTLDPPEGLQFAGTVPATQETFSGRRYLPVQEQVEISWVTENSRWRALMPLGVELSLLMSGVLFGLAPLAYLQVPRSDEAHANATTRAKVQPPLPLVRRRARPPSPTMHRQTVRRLSRRKR